MIRLKRFFEIYDEKKLNKQDRRLVFQYVTDSTLHCAFGKMSNVALFLSITSILIASFSVGYSLTARLSTGPIITGTVNLVIFVFILILYIQSNKKLDGVIKSNIRDQYQVSDVHFKYAKREQ